MKIVTIHQPNFMPWLGFFDKVAQSDILVVLDNVQYSKNVMINRNKIKTSQGEKWLTVPVGAHICQDIAETLIDNNQSWRSKHLKTLEVNYKKSLNFAKIYPLINEIYSKKQNRLMDLNLEIIQLFNKLLGIEIPMVLSSSFGICGKGDGYLVDIVKKTGAGIYLSGIGAKAYLDEEKFKKNDIKVVWQNYNPLVYKQCWGKFVPNLSALDFIFCARYENFFALKNKTKDLV